MVQLLHQILNHDIKSAEISVTGEVDYEISDRKSDSMTDNLLYKIGLSMITGIGSVTAKSLIAYTGSAEQVFREKEKALRKIPGVGSVLAKNIANSEVMKRANLEVEFLQKTNVNAF